MRIKIKYWSAIAIVFYVIVLLLLWKKLTVMKKDDSTEISSTDSANKYLRFENLVTVIIRDFEHFENDVVDTVESLLSIAPTLKIIIASNSPPYPPLHWKWGNNSTVKLVSSKLEVGGLREDRDFLNHVCTPLVLFIPDSIRATSRKDLVDLLYSLDEPGVHVLAAPVSKAKSVACLRMKLNIRMWTLTYDKSPSELFCDGVTGKHLLLIQKEDLLKLPDPFILPFPDSLYIQARAKNIKTRLLRTAIWNEGRALHQSQHLLWKTQRLKHERQQRMFERLGIKRVIRDGKDEWYGCTRDSTRCFGTVIADTPSYLYEGKWTPPCCLAALRTTARHVFKQLESAGIRYWLEGGSLLGAMRSGDILPWDFDVDLGFMREDLPKLSWLLRASRQPVVDTQGFVWEKATEGDFYRVQYSRSNRLHVDLFPFHNKNGTMTKDTWFPTHRQDVEFPAHYLNPLSSIKFVGLNVSAPNNIRDFLEFKFGLGAIENPAYPNPAQLKFPIELLPSKKTAEYLGADD